MAFLICAAIRPGLRADLKNRLGSSVRSGYNKIIDVTDLAQHKKDEHTMERSAGIGKISKQQGPI